MHVALFRFSSLGDVVLSSSMITALRKTYGPKLEISFLTSKPFAQIFEGHKELNRVVELPRQSGIRGIKELVSAFKSFHRLYPVDLFVDLHSTLRSQIIKTRFWMIPSIKVSKRSVERKLRVISKVSFFKKGRKDYGERLALRNCRDFSWPLSLSNEQIIFKRRSLEFEKSTIKNSEELLTSIGASFSTQDLALRNRFKFFEKDFIVMCPSASFSQKRWSEKSFLNLFKLLLQENITVVCLGGKEDTFCRIFDPLTEEYPELFFNEVGKTSLADVCEIVKKALLVVGNDTGIPHIAESVGTPALVISGPTGEDFGFAPFLDKSDLIKRDLWCRPCMTKGNGYCFRREQYCLTQISASDVYVKIKDVLSDL